MDELRRMRPLLGTYVEVSARGPTAATGPAVAAAFHRIEEAQRLWSFHAPDSDLSRLNGARGKAVTLHPQTLRLLRLARALTAASGSRFNCTLGGALVRRGALPDHDHGAMLDRGTAEDIEIESDRARLRRPVRLTLDGLAKGYAVDLAVRALRKTGMVAGWVNAGGDLRVFGDVVLPVHRREIDGRMTSLGGLRDAALASSLVRRRSDTDDPSFPALIVGTDNVSPAAGVWTVLARSAWRADALTKVASIAAPQHRASLVARLGGHLIESKTE